MAISLVKGQKISLSKESGGSLRHLLVGLGWDLPLLKLQSFDLDAFAFVCGEDGKMSSLKDVVYFANLTHPSNAVRHTGDNLTGEGEGDDEQILIDLDKLPAEYTHILLGVCIYLGDKRKQSFDKVKNAFVRIEDRDSRKEICRYTLSDNSKFAGKTTMAFGEIYQKNGEWKFSAIGEATEDVSITPGFSAKYLRSMG